MPGARPVRLQTRKMWVSTAIVASPKATFSTTLAVLRPTPGSASSSARLRGTRPPCRSTRSSQVRYRLAALLRYRPMVLERIGQRRQTEGEHLLRRVGDRKQAPRRLVDADIGGLRRQQHRGQQLEHAGVFELGRRLRIGRAQRREERFDGRDLHDPDCARPAWADRTGTGWPISRRAARRARASAAAMRVAGPAVPALTSVRDGTCGEAAGRCASSSPAAAPVAAAIGLTRACPACDGTPGLPAGAARRGRLEVDAVDRTDRQAQLAAGAIVGDHGVHALGRADDAVDRARLDAQGAADAGRLVDPGQGARSLQCRTLDRAASAARPVSAARRAMPSAPPGGQRLIGAPAAIAAAYAAQSGSPQRVHCVCGSSGVDRRCRHADRQRGRARCSTAWLAHRLDAGARRGLTLARCGRYRSARHPCRAALRCRGGCDLDRRRQRLRCDPTDRNRRRCRGVRCGSAR